VDVEQVRHLLDVPAGRSFFAVIGLSRRTPCAIGRTGAAGAADRCGCAPALAFRAALASFGGCLRRRPPAVFSSVDRRSRAGLRAAAARSDLRAGALASAAGERGRGGLA